MKSTNVSVHKTQITWCIAFEIKINKETIVIAAVYLSASENKNAVLDVFEPWFESISNERSIICCGDFNINLNADNQYSRRLKNIIYDNGLRQIVDTPTRVVQSSSTLIDLCVTNLNNNKISCNVSIEDQISDHRNIEVVITGQKNETNPKKKYIEVWSDYNIEKLWESIEVWLPQWSQIVNKSVDDKTTWLLSNLKSSLNKFRKTKQVNDKNDFFDGELESMRREKNKLYKIAQYSRTDEAWKDYKVYKNVYKNKIQTKKYATTQRQLGKVAGNMKGTWKILNSMLNGNKSEVTSINTGSNLIENDAEIANSFNKFFVESIRDINARIPNVNYVNTDRSIANESFQFQAISISDIKLCLRDMKQNLDEYNLNAKVLIDCLDLVATPLADIINHSFISGVFPSALKTATIIPIQKVTNTTLINEFRPINMLPCIEKIIERLAYNQFNDFIIRNSILKNHQSGFRGSHSCESAINDVLREWKEAQNDSKSLIAVFLDLQRAFETIEPKILIAKLRKIGIQEKTLKWFESYLFGRKQRVKFNGVVSDEISNDLGVPQGSILGPLLFILYINELGDCLKYCKIKMFADDTLIYIIFDNTEDACSKLNEDLSFLFKNLCQHKLRLNVSKTKAMLISNKKNIDTNTIDIKINDEKIDLVNEIKYLGIVIDCKLKFEANTDYICKKVGKKINVLARLRNELNCQQKILVYKTIIEPHFTYCSTILFLSTQADINRLQKMQNKCMRNILKLDRFSHEKDMLEILNFQSVQQTIKFYTLFFIYKIVNGYTPQYLSDKIIYNNQNERKNTLRNRNNIELVKATKACSQNSLFYKGISIFNKLPDSIKNEKSVNRFKKSLKDVIFMEQI